MAIFLVVSLSEYSCRFLVDVRGERTSAETAYMSAVFGNAYGNEVVACRSYQDALHTRRVPDKEKPVTSIRCGGKEGICGCRVAGR